MARDAAGAVNNASVPVGTKPRASLTANKRPRVKKPNPMQARAAKKSEPEAASEVSKEEIPAPRIVSSRPPLPAVGYNLADDFKDVDNEEAPRAAPPSSPLLAVAKKLASTSAQVPECQKSKKQHAALEVNMSDLVPGKDDELIRKLLEKDQAEQDTGPDGTGIEGVVAHKPLPGVKRKLKPKKFAKKAAGLINKEPKAHVRKPLYNAYYIPPQLEGFGQTVERPAPKRVPHARKPRPEPVDLNGDHPADDGVAEDNLGEKDSRISHQKHGRKSPTCAERMERGRLENAPSYCTICRRKGWPQHVFKGGARPVARYRLEEAANFEKKAREQPFKRDRFLRNAYDVLHPHNSMDYEKYVAMREKAMKEILLLEDNNDEVEDSAPNTLSPEDDYSDEDQEDESEELISSFAEVAKPPGQFIPEPPSAPKPTIKRSTASLKVRQTKAFAGKAKGKINQAPRHFERPNLIPDTQGPKFFPKRLADRKTQIAKQAEKEAMKKLTLENNNQNNVQMVYLSTSKPPSGPKQNLGAGKEKWKIRTTKAFREKAAGKLKKAKKPFKRPNLIPDTPEAKFIPKWLAVKKAQMAEEKGKKAEKSMSPPLTAEDFPASEYPGTERTNVATVAEKEAGALEEAYPDEETHNDEYADAAPNRATPVDIHGDDPTDENEDELWPEHIAKRLAQPRPPSRWRLEQAAHLEQQAREHPSMRNCLLREASLLLNPSARRWDTEKEGNAEEPMATDPFIPEQDTDTPMEEPRPAMAKRRIKSDCYPGSPSPRIQSIQSMTGISEEDEDQYEEKTMEDLLAEEISRDVASCCEERAPWCLFMEEDRQTHLHSPASGRITQITRRSGFVTKLSLGDQMMRKKAEKELATMANLHQRIEARKRPDRAAMKARLDQEMRARQYQERIAFEQEEREWIMANQRKVRMTRQLQERTAPVAREKQKREATMVHAQQKTGFPLFCTHKIPGFFQDFIQNSRYNFLFFNVASTYNWVSVYTLYITSTPFCYTTQKYAYLPLQPPIMTCIT